MCTYSPEETARGVSKNAYLFSLSLMISLNKTESVSTDFSHKGSTFQILFTYSVWYFDVSTVQMSQHLRNGAYH